MDGVAVLVIDDEPPIRRLLRTSLGAQGFAVDEAADAAAGLAAIRAGKPDVILLDLGLPDGDGTEFVRRLRAAGDRTPVIVLSGRDAEKIKVEALDAGADDYVTKPFGMAELVARIRTALRHRIHQEGGEPLYRRGNVTVDLVRRHIVKGGLEVKLSPKEYAILRLLVVHAGKVLTHRMIMGEVWGAAGDVQYLRIYVRQLRGKLEDDRDRPTLILTETGVGYRLAEPDP